MFLVFRFGSLVDRILNIRLILRLLSSNSVGCYLYLHGRCCLRIEEK